MISKITLLKEKDEYVGFEVIQDDKTIQVKNENLEDFKRSLVNYMNQLTNDQYLEEYDNKSKKEIRLDLTKRGFLTEKEVTKKKVVDNIQPTELPKESKVKGRKTAKISKRALALVVGSAIAVGSIGTGVIVSVSHNKKKNSTSYSNLEPIDFPDLTDPTITGNENLSYLYEDMTEFNQNEMPDIAVFSNSLDNYYQVSRDEFAQINDYRYDNKYELTAEGTIIPYENAVELLDNNMIDRLYVKYFSDLRNQIIQNFYNRKDENSGLVYINAAGDEIIRCLKFNEPINIQYNQENIFIAFGNLSDEAKKVVLSIVSDIYIAMYDYDTFSYDNKNYNKNDIETTISELLYELDDFKQK